MSLQEISKTFIGKKATHIASGNTVEITGLHVDANLSVQYQIENIDKTGAIQTAWVSEKQISLTNT